MHGLTGVIEAESIVAFNRKLGKWNKNIAGLRGKSLREENSYISVTASLDLWTQIASIGIVTIL